MGRHSAPTKRELRRQAALVESVDSVDSVDSVESVDSIEQPEHVDVHPTAERSDPVEEPASIEQPTSADPEPAEPAPAQAEPAEPAIEQPVGLSAFSPVVVGAGATATTRPNSLGPVRHLPRRIAIGAAIAMLTAGTLGFVGLGKSVTVVVDGDPTSVTTYAADVDGALDDAGVSTDSEDAVTPSLSSEVADGQTVEVIRAREIALDIDGASTTETVTALTADDALDELGLQGYAIASGGDSLPLKGGALTLSAPKDLTIQVDGQAERVVSSATTVDGVLDEAGIELGKDDTTAPERDAKPTDGATITVTRNDVSVITEERDLPYTTVEQSNPSEYIGIDSVASEGTNGKASVTVEVKSVDGVQVSKTDLSTEIVTAPVDRVILKGAKDFPADVNAKNWDALAMCESTMNPKAVNKTNGKYFGLYQFSVETWAGVGGSGNPADATVEEQTARAKILFMKYGASQWECGSHLND